MSETKKALSRLAASEVRSAAGAQAGAAAKDDKVEAMAQIIEVLSVPIMQARFVYDKLIRHLQGSDLTINFRAYKFFNTMPKGKGYDNQFGGGQRWGDDSYFTARDTAEEAMFDISGNKGVHGSLPQQVAQRLKKLGGFNAGGNLDFQPVTRPKYAALNYARLRHGSARQWGHSYFVLKEHVKHNCTYVESDSFDFTGSNKQVAVAHNKVASFVDMARLIANMAPNMLKALNQSANGHDFGAVDQVPGLGSTGYIEAHIHGEVLFNRDVAKIVVSAAEISAAATESQKLQAKQPQLNLRIVTPEQLRQIFRKFSQKYGVPVQEVA